jgi:uncharacterized OB-fold protein
MSTGPALDPLKHLRREMDGTAREFYRRLAEGRLSTTECPDCGRVSFPPRDRCAGCTAQQRWIDLPLEGRLFAFTTQERALRFTAPAVLALAEVGPVILPGIAEGPYERLRIGQEVGIALRPEPETGLTLLAFEPPA